MKPSQGLIVAGSGERPRKNSKNRGSRCEIMQIGSFKIHLGTFGDAAVANVPSGRNFLEVITVVALPMSGFTALL
jgi:hypothetical protein